MIKVIGFKKIKSGIKKYEITFEKNGKKYIRKFGAAGMSDFTKHKDKSRRERYISRHKKDLRTNDPMKPGYLSMYILWNKPTIKASLVDYKRRLNVYNRTGKFPKGITGSKKLSFGTIIPFDETSLNVLPADIQRLIQRDVSASNIQRIQRGINVRKIPANMMTKKFLKQLLWKINAEYESPEYANEMMQLGGEPWLVLNPAQENTAKWLYYAADILTAKDFDDDDLWYNCLERVVDEFVDMNPDVIIYEGQVAINLTVSEDNIEILLQKIGHSVNFDVPRWYNRALVWLQEEYSTGNAFGKKYIVPDNVVNKSLYSTIKAKIKRSIKGRRWGAYDSGRLVREYKAKGGKYRRGKGKTDLGRWYKEKWIDACVWPKRKPCGRKTKEKIAYCRPSVKVDSKTPKLVQKLTKAQINSRCAKKKRSPMKRITKFGQTTEDEPVGDGWVIHCNFVQGIGPHATLRRLDEEYMPSKKRDHAYRYGIKEAGKPPEFWTSGPLTGSIPSPAFQQLLINYFYYRCNGYNIREFPPSSPAPGPSVYLSSFGNIKSVDFYKQLMRTGNDPLYISKKLKEQLKLRGGKTGSKILDNYLIELFLNIFHTVQKQLPKNQLRQQITNMIKPVENKFRKITGYRYTSLPIKKSDYPKLRTLLGLMQDEVLDYTKNVANLASAVLAYIS
jgi:hypothetical protein